MRSDACVPRLGSGRPAHPVILILITAILITAMISPHPATAQNVISDLSEREVPIEWDFDGAKIILFGAIDLGSSEKTQRDVIIAVKGPNMSLTTRKKDRIAGIWVNNQSAVLHGVPTYYSIVSNRPLDKIAPESELAGLRLGLKFVTRDFHPRSLELSKALPEETKVKEREFNSAVIRIMKKNGLYKEDPFGVTITGGRLFRANLSLPANVPVGRFTADVFLFADGKLVSRQLSSLHIHKRGIERTITTLAFDYPFLYGILCVVIAVAAGLGASLVTGKR